MSKKDEALKLALEALREDRAWLESDAPDDIWVKNLYAITAATEALAEQPAQPIKQGWDVETLLNKPKQPVQQEHVTDKEIEKQERVVWITNSSLYRLMRTEAETVTIYKQKTKVARIPLVIKGLP